MTAFYNDFDQHACRWLQSLIAGGLITEGDVDGRSINDIRADELTLPGRRAELLAAEPTPVRDIVTPILEQWA